MNGLELIKSLSKELPKTRCIMLTGYQEFEYARTALKYGAAGYLLKPVDEGEILEIISGIREKLEMENREKNNLEDMSQRLLKTAAYIRNQILFSIVNGDIKKKDEVLKALSLNNIEGIPHRYLCFIIDIDWAREMKYSYPRTVSWSNLQPQIFLKKYLKTMPEAWFFIQMKQKSSGSWILGKLTKANL